MANGNRGRHRDVEETTSDEGAPRARAIWSGTLTFGLVSIPVELFPANRPGRVGLRMLGRSGAPLRRHYVCPKDGHEVPPEHLVRGYEVAPDEYVVVTDAELEALQPAKSRDIDLARFVPVDEVDPVLFDRAYYLAPTGSSAKAYRLLASVMEESGRAGIATFVMRGKEYLVAILAEAGILRAETLRFADEVRTAEDVGLPAMKKPKAADVQRFARAVHARAEKALDPDELGDPWTQKLVALAEKKRKRGEDVVESAQGTAEEEQAEVVDLMEVLKRSLGTTAAAQHGARRRAAASRRPAVRRKSSARRK